MEKKIVLNNFIEIPDLKFNSKDLGIISNKPYDNAALIKTDKPLDQTPICLKVSLNQAPLTIYNYISEQKIKYKIDSIELIDTHFFTKTYAQYEVNLLVILQMLKDRNISHISLHVDIYLNEVLTNIKKYKDLINYLDVPIYGTCIKENSSLVPLLTYKINKETLTKNINILKNNDIDLSIEVKSSCEHIENITNTFGSVLWLLDFLFQISLANVKRMFINMEDINNKFAFDLFKKVTNDNVSFIKFTMETDLMPNISVYSTRSLSTYYITIIHKDDTLEEVIFDIDLSVNTNATITRLFNNETITGSQTIEVSEEKTNSLKNIKVKKFTTVVIEIPLMAGGAFFPTINDEDEKNAYVTLRPEANEYDSIPTTMTIEEFKKNYQAYM
jgi:hypothetical protein